MFNEFAAATDLELLADLDEAEVELAAKVVGQPPVVVVDAQVGRADLANAQLLLLVRRRRHGVAVLLFGRRLLLPYVLHLIAKTPIRVSLDKLCPSPFFCSAYLFHHLHGLVDEALGAELLGLGEFLADLLGQLVHLLRFGRHLGRELLLRLGQPFFGRLRLPVALTDERRQVVHRLAKTKNQRSIASKAIGICSTRRCRKTKFLKTNKKFKNLI